MVLPTYNRAHILAGSIKSVLDQTYRELELIVVDDGSTDGTGRVVSSIGDERVRLVKFESNRGQSAARNAGIAASRFELVAFQDSDDIWRADKLSQQVGPLARDAGLAGVYCDLNRHFLDGRAVVMEAPELKTGTYFDGRPSLYQTYGLGIQSCVLRKAVLAEAGGFREDLDCFEDLEMLLRIAHRHRLHRVPQPLVDYHESAGSVSTNGRAEQRARRFLLAHYGIRALFGHPIEVARQTALAFLI